MFFRFEFIIWFKKISYFGLIIKNLFEIDSVVKNIPYPNSFNPALEYPNLTIKYFCKDYYKVNDVGFPIVNNFNKSLTDNNLNSIDLTNNELYKGIPKQSDESNNNKFYIKHNDFSQMFNKKLKNVEIGGQDYEIKSNSTDMSINKCLLNIILDQLNLLFTNKKYNIL